VRIIVATIGAIALRQLATEKALSDARSVTVTFSRGLLHKEVTPGMLRGDRASLPAARPPGARDVPPGAA
jgi:hypothetical protein